MQIKTMDDLINLFSYLVNNTSEEKTSEDERVSNEPVREEACPCQNYSCNTNNDVNIRDYIDKVIFRDKYTIVFWNDGTKSKVKCGAHDTYDPEKGLAMALLKGMLGNRYFRDMTKIIAEFPKVEEKPKKKTEDKTETTKAKTETKAKAETKKTTAKTAPKKTAAKSTKKTTKE